MTTRSMVRAALALVILQVQVRAGSPSGEDLPARARAIPPGSFVELVRTNESRMAGRAVEISSQTVRLRSATGNRTEIREIPIEELKSIQLKRRPDLPDGKPSVAERALIIDPGATIKLTLNDGRKLRGTLGEITPDGFTLGPAKGQDAASQPVRFEEVRSIGETRPVGLAGKIVIVAAIAAAVFVAVVVTLTATIGT